jgi:mono/diheme cytochrome c family protein
MWTLAVVGGTASALVAAAPQPQAPAPSVKPAPYSAIGSVEGKDNFAAYCAVCHGLDGRGGGPAAPAMKAPMPDLTMLAARNNGKFDGAAVEYVIRGTAKTATPVHGSVDMPIWGTVFASSSGGRQAADVRIRNLVQYVASLQRSR